GRMTVRGHTPLHRPRARLLGRARSALKQALRGQTRSAPEAKAKRRITSNVIRPTLCKVRRNAVVGWVERSDTHHHGSMGFAGSTHPTKSVPAWSTRPPQGIIGSTISSL